MAGVAAARRRRARRSPPVRLLGRGRAPRRRLAGGHQVRASRDRREHGHLVGVAHRLVGLAGLAVAPDGAVLEEGAERRRRSGRGRRRGRPPRWRPAPRHARCRRPRGPRRTVAARPTVTSSESANAAASVATAPSGATQPNAVVAIPAVRVGSPAMTRVLLIRHGQSEWNADGRWQGQADPPLTDLGRHQALHAARNLGTVDAIVASDLQRASETALIIAEALGVGPVVLEPGLRERDAGEWSGLTRAEIERDWPGYLDPPTAPDRHAGRSPATRRAAEGASGGGHPAGSRTRCCSSGCSTALGRVHDLAPDGEVIAITHGGVSTRWRDGSARRSSGSPTSAAAGSTSAPEASSGAWAIGSCSSTPTSSPSPPSSERRRWPVGAAQWASGECRGGGRGHGSRRDRGPSRPGSTRRRTPRPAHRPASRRAGRSRSSMFMAGIITREALGHLLRRDAGEDRLVDRQRPRESRPRLRAPA